MDHAPISDAVMTDQESNESPAQWITIREAARRAGIPYRTLYHWVEADVWPVRVVRLGKRRLRVDAASFESWLLKLRAERQDDGSLSE